MKRFIVPFVIAMIAGISVASAASFLRAKRVPVFAAATKPAVADTTHERVIDSVAVSVAPKAVPRDTTAHHGDSATKRVAATTVSAPTPPTTAAPHAPTLPTSLAAAQGPKQTPTVAAPTAVLAADAGPAEKRVAKVIAAMPPRDAAKVLTQLADHDIAIIIGNLTEKQEAAILAQLPADRLASVSKLALHSTPRVK